MTEEAAAGPTQAEVYQGLNSDQKRAAVVAAGSVTELDEMWAAWEERGHSREGILYMLVLKQKASLGYELSEEEAAQVATTEEAARRGAAEPPIGGAFTPPGS